MSVTWPRLKTAGTAKHVPATVTHLGKKSVAKPLLLLLSSITGRLKGNNPENSNIFYMLLDNH